VPLCEYRDDGWDDATKQPCQTPIARKQFSTRRKIWNSSNEGGIEDMIIDTLIQTLPTIRVIQTQHQKTINFGGT
jgi:hypothetical protein